jgi:ADP-ribosylglycohydrolase
MHLPQLQESVVGCILGGAIGDAMGGPYEGKEVPIVINEQARWRLSDDTQLTLATCEAIITAGQCRRGLQRVLLNGSALVVFRVLGQVH